ncbi:MAG TPA: AAA family ATPase [Bacillota bacterium]|nr:AAA family ATPase [Bacillota bacterium]HOH09782.1 AAA family ATPase [Bacillota bacterium]HPI00669.1 AAA family ATPase [Bacillota bacterium]HPM63822.1 AAA family ATPase [Bacillota bacterium]
MKYLSLALEGFGCFRERTVFEFKGGIDTLYRLNESGKSTMVNGLVHTIYGLRKQGKDKFRSWRGSPSFRGELTFSSKGGTYRIDMDFAADKVAVSVYDEDTGGFVNLIRGQVHVPAGKRSQKYDAFVQEHFGTIDVEVFRSAFVLEQPNENDPGLGKGWGLTAKSAYGDYEGARQKLFARLGKDMSTGITMRLKQYGESDQREKRRLEQVEDSIEEDRAKLRRAKEDLDRIAPLNEKLQSKLQEAEDARLNKMSWTGRRTDVEAWMKLRERWIAKNEEHSRKKADLDQICVKMKEKQSHVAELENLKAGFDGPGMPPSRLDAIMDAFSEAKGAIKDAKAVKAGHGWQGGLSGELLETDLTEAGAEQRLMAVYAKASEARRMLDEAVFAREAWESRFKDVAGLTDDDREMMGKEASKKEKADLKGKSGPLVKFSPVLGILAGFVIAYLLFRKPSDRTAMVLTIALCSVLGFVLKAYLERRPAVKPEEGASGDSGLEARIKLFDEMKASVKPALPEDVAATCRQLSDVMRDADSLSRLALITARAIGRIMANDTADACDIAGYDMDLGVKGLMAKEGDFWSEAIRKNNAKNERQKLIEAKASQIVTDEKVIDGLINARGSDIQALTSDVEATRQQAEAIMSEWERKFSHCTYLKVTIDKEALMDAQQELRLAEEGEKEYDRIAKDRSDEAGRLNDELREARSHDIDNIPELEEKLAYEEGLKEALKCEERALALAIEQLDAANAEFGSSSLKAMKKNVTELLGLITGDSARVVEVGEDLRLMISSDGTAVSYDQLSQGTKDQLNVCVKVAAAELLGEGRSMPMFFDDSFGTTDETRLGRIRELLVRMSRTRQFIVLSHSKEIDGWGVRVNIT